MGLIINILIQIVISLLISMLFSKPVDSNVKPAGISDFKFPTASQSRPIPVLWGTTEFKAPNTTWAGDFYVEKITKKVSSGFSSKKITVGYKYHMGLQLVLCLGGTTTTQHLDKLTRMRFGEKVAWEGVATAGDVIRVSQANLFGGNEQGGGIAGRFKFYAGTDDQQADDYLESQLGEVPARAGVSYVVWYGGSSIDSGAERRDGYVSNSTNLRTMWFTGTRQPNTLGVQGGIHQIGEGANPACMIHELLTEQDWGMGWSDSNIEIADLETMAQTLYDEGFGLSLLWDNEKTIQDVLDDIIEHISGYYYEDKITGKLRFGLLRADYDVNTIESLSRPTIIEVEEFTRSTWEGSMNEITVTYSNPERYYELDAVTVNDLGNVYIQKKVVGRTNQYHGITDKALAVQVGFRDLRMLSIPLARAVFKCNRSVSTWVVGQPFKWSDDQYEIENMVMRVNKIERGDFLSGEVIIHCIEDVFTRGETLFSVPDDDQWVPPSFDPVELTELTEVELPRQFSLYPDNALPEVLTLVKNSSPINVTYDAYWGTSAALLANDEVENETFSDFGAALSGLGLNEPSYSATSRIKVSQLTANPDRGQGADRDSLIYINGEIIGYDSATLDADGNWVLVGLHRGLMNTVMGSHPINSTVFLLNGGGFIPPVEFAVGATVHYKLVPQGVSGALEVADVAGENYTFVGEKARPHVLTDLKVNDVYDLLYEAGTDVVVTWGNNPMELDDITDSNDVTQAVAVDTDYTVTVEDYTGVLATDNVQALANSNVLNTATFTAASLFAGEVPPYFWVTVKATANSLDSTFTALKTVARPMHEIAITEGVGITEPVGKVVYFNGKLVGVRNGT